VKAWLPTDFEPPQILVVPPEHHFRPIRASDVGIDYPAVMGSRERLWATFGRPWTWPLESMTLEQDRADLARHEYEMVERRSFNYALLDEEERSLAGCVYIDPPERKGADADISWWVVDDLVSTPLDVFLSVLIPRWVGECWPFAEPRFIGLDITWDEWLRLPRM
jgi:hypothetical protein